MSRAASLITLALLPFLLGNQPPECPPGTPATVIERQARAEVAPEIAATMPREFRYRIRTDRPLAWLGTDVVTVESDRHDLTLGSRWAFWLSVTLTDEPSRSRTRPIHLGECGVRPLPATSPAPRGCGHCGTGAGAVPLAVLALRTRRRRA